MKHITQKGTCNDEQKCHNVDSFISTAYDKAKFFSEKIQAAKFYGGEADANFDEDGVSRLTFFIHGAPQLKIDPKSAYVFK